MSIERLNLFDSKREMIYFLIFIISLFGINLFFDYKCYKDLTSSKFNHTNALVLNQYPKFTKKGKPYYVLRLKSSDGYKFITTNFEDIKDLKQREIRVGIITNKITFLDFLRGFFAPTYDLELLEYQNSPKQQVKNYIKKQHENNLTKELFSALFLATPISKNLREKISNLGISHLVAISGYHLGFLYALLFGVFAYLYKLFQDRYFPYRNRVYDLTLFILFLLLLYAYFLDFTPSLLRSFSMMAFGFLLYTRHINIFSFEVLTVVVLFLIAIDPMLLFSVGFWFSVSGIFYIYLFIHHFSNLNRWIMIILINVWVFLLMSPIIHYIFAKFTYYQLLSPILSILFVLFYPLELFLHLIGYGGLVDSWLLKLLNLDMSSYEVKTPFWFLIIYIIISILSIRYKSMLTLLVIMSLAFYIFSI